MSDTENKKLKKQHKVLKVVVAIIGVLIALVVIGNLLGGSQSTTSGTSTAANNTSTSTSASTTANAAASTPGLNQPANDGKFQFTVTSFACGQSQLENDNQFETATAQGQFCVMKLNIKNIGTAAQEFDPTAQYVYTSDGKQLSYSSDGTTAANNSGSQCYLYQTINPGNSLDCNVAFDVPAGVTPPYAMLHDSSMSNGVKINL